MKKIKAVEIDELIKKINKAENALLIKRSKHISKNLKKFIKLKSKLIEWEQS